MARTKQEVRNFLNSQVGRRVPDKSNPDYNGQCVALLKSLLEFLGVPNPYASRGNAKDVGDTYLRQGIAKNGDGWLRVVVNRSMGKIGGKTYGHVWVDLRDEANFEQNGSKALHTTKNTRPYAHRQQVVNLDQYIKADPKPAPAPSGGTYTVKKGDSLSKVFGNNWQAVYNLNRGVIGPDPNKLKVGQVLKLPGAPAPKPAPAPSNNYHLNQDVPGYKSSADAINRRNSNSTVRKGIYRLSNRVKGADHLVRPDGSGGWWIKV